MRLKTKAMVLTVALIAPFTIATHASASGAGYQYSASANRKVITTKNVQLYRVTVGKDEAHNKFKLMGTLKAGAYLKISKWIMSTGGGYVVRSGRFYPDANHFYFIFAGKNSKWNEKYTWERMNNIETKKNNIEIAKEEQQDKKQQKEEYEEYNLPQGQYQYTSDQNALNNVGYLLDDDGNINEKYAPTDKRALVPTGFQPKDNQEWYAGTKSWVFLNQQDAKSLEYNNSGWMPEK